jgi:hypothetical protein
MYEDWALRVHRDVGRFRHDTDVKNWLMRGSIPQGQPVT